MEEYEEMHFPIRFVHKTQKFSVFGLTWGHKRSRDSVTVLPIFVNLVSKDAQDLKEKSQEVAWRETQRFEFRGENCRGGAMMAPPPVFLGLKVGMYFSGLIFLTH